jgi:pyruvate dehydrogenase E2 component (dihydrolipoamide acetyltransferase)
MSTTASTVAVPDIGDFDDVPVIEILVSVGDTVAAEDPLVTLESDKATMDVPAPFAGVVKDIKVSVGDKVSQGTELMLVEGEGEAPADQAAAEDVPEAEAAEKEEEAEEIEEASAPSQPSQPSEPSQPSQPSQPSEPSQRSERSESGSAGKGPSRSNGAGPIYASPSARRLARELGVNIAQVSGSGRKGRITKEDVQAAADGHPSTPDGAPAAPSQSGAGLDLLPWPSIEFEKFGPVERVARSRIQRISAPNLARNWVMIPHVTHNDEADVTDLEAWRKQLNGEQSELDDTGAARSGEAGGRAGGKPVKVTMVSFLVLASVAALKEFPDFNSSLDGDELVLKRYYNIGFAADTPGGLVVPVIKDADRKGLLEIAADLTSLSGRAREGKLSREDMSGASFTISSLGGIGGTSFTPIINAPEVAILGATRSAMKPVWNGAEFVARLMVPLSLSYDHRVIDGAAAARFVSYLVKVLSDLRRALL